MPVILSILMLVAFGCWIVAAVSALQVVGLAPKGTRFRTYMNLGWWRHGRIVAAIGPAAEAPLMRYRMAFYGFFSVIIGAIAATFLMTMTGSGA